MKCKHNKLIIIEYSFMNFAKVCKACGDTIIIYSNLSKVITLGLNWQGGTIHQVRQAINKGA